jgi:hypothetical protein
VVVAGIAAFPGSLPFTVGVPVGAVLAGAVAGAAFVAITAPDRVRAAWMAPVVAVAACAGRAWGMEGRLGTLAFCCAMTPALLLAATWGPPPWPSRFVGPWSGRCAHPHHRATLLVVATVAVGLAVVTADLDGTARTATALATTTTLEAGVVIAAFAVRMWRFNPRRRVGDIATLVIVGVAALTIYLPLALVHNRVAVLVAALCLVGVGALTWPFVNTVSAASRAGTRDRRTLVRSERSSRKPEP